MARSFPFFDIIVLLILTLYILNKYGNWRRQRFAVTLATLVAWYFSFIIIGILPLDVSMTTYYQCLAKSNISFNKTTSNPHPLNYSANFVIYDVTTLQSSIEYPSYADTSSQKSIPNQKHSKKRILTVKRTLDDVPEIPPPHSHNTEGPLLKTNNTIHMNIFHSTASPIDKFQSSTQHFLTTQKSNNITSTSSSTKNLSILITLIPNNSVDPYVSNNKSGEPLTMVCEKPWNYIPRSVLPSLWRIVYWTSQVLTWFVLPLMQTYSKAGDFTIFGKIKTALYENLLWYGSYVLIFIVLMVYVAFKPNLHFDMSKILTICSSASNTWGLTLLVILLGYGLIEVPRALWRYSFMSGRIKLDRCFYKAALLFPKKAEAEENLEEVLEDVKQLVSTVPTQHAARHKVDILINKIPESYKLKMNLKSASEAADEGSRLHRALDIPPNQKGLVKLNKRLIASLTAHYRTQMQWQALMESIIGLERDLRHFSSKSSKTDLTATGNNTSTSEPTSTQNNMDPTGPGYRYSNWKRRGDRAGDEATTTTSNGDFRDTVFQGDEYDLTEISHKGGRWERCLHLGRRRSKIFGIYFRRYIRPWFYRLLALIFGCFSFAVIWSELVLFKRDPALSLFAIFFELAKKHSHNYIHIQIVSILTITYLSVCAYFPIFKLRLFDFYALIPHHHTDENSLLFSGLLLSRLTSPLCLNFLCLIHMDRYVSPGKAASDASNPGTRYLETTFIQVMGRMEFLPIIAHGFNVYFPMAIFILCLANYFDLARKFLRTIGYSRATASDFNEYYVNNKAGDNTSSGHAEVLALVEEGKQLARRDFRNRAIKESRDSRPKEDLASRYGGGTVRSDGSMHRVFSANSYQDRHPYPPEDGTRAIIESRTDTHLNIRSSSREDLIPKRHVTGTAAKYRDLLSGVITKASTHIGPGLSGLYNTFKKSPSQNSFAPRNEPPDPSEFINSANSIKPTPDAERFEPQALPPKNIFDDI